MLTSVTAIFGLLFMKFSPNCIELWNWECYSLFLEVFAVFLQDQNFWGSLMTPCLKIWGSLANLEGQNFLMYNFSVFLYLGHQAIYSHRYGLLITVLSTLVYLLSVCGDA